MRSIYLYIYNIHTIFSTFPLFLSHGLQKWKKRPRGRKECRRSPEGIQLFAHAQTVKNSVVVFFNGQQCSKMFEKMLVYCWIFDLMLVWSCWKLNLWILSRTVEAHQRNVVLTSVSSCKFVLFLRPVFITLLNCDLWTKIRSFGEDLTLNRLHLSCPKHSRTRWFFSMEASGDSSAELWTLRVQALLEVEVVGPRHRELSELVRCDLWTTSG